MKEPKATPTFGAGRRSKYRRGAPEAPVQAITNAAIPHSDDMRHRMIQYSVTMGIRMVCLLLIFVFDGWFKLVPIVGAVVLPWVAVMIANSGADIVHRDGVELMDEIPLYAVGAGETMADDAGASPDDILPGELVPDTDDTDGSTAEGSRASDGGTGPTGTDAEGSADDPPTPGPATAGFAPGARFAAGPDGTAYMAGPNSPAEHAEEAAQPWDCAQEETIVEEKHHEHL